MPTLYISEFYGRAPDAQGATLPIALVPAVVDQALAIGATTAASAAFNATTRMVRLATDATCSVAFGTTPTATVTTMRLAAGAVEYFGVPAGGNFKVAVIANT